MDGLAFQNQAADGAFNDNAPPSAVFKTSPRALLLPAAIAGLLWLALAAWFYAQGGLSSSSARFALAAFFLTVPLLLGHAALRALTVRVVVARHGLSLRRGFFPAETLRLPWSLVKTAEMKRGLGGRISGSGTLVLGLATGQVLAVADLAEPDAVLRALNAEAQRGETEALEALGVTRRHRQSGVAAMPEAARRAS